MGALEANGTKRGVARAGYDEPVTERPKTPPVFHVWVSLSNLSGKPDILYPGLVLGWRRARTGWEAHVAWVTPDASAETVHMGWLEAHRLHPVEHQ